MESAKPCPNCINLVPETATLCPHCGANLAPPPRVLQATPAWPPSPAGGPPVPPPPRSPLVTGNAAGDIVLGVVIALASMFIGGLGILVMPILYFVLRPSVPCLARGIGYGTLTSLALLLGAFALCFYGFSHESH